MSKTCDTYGLASLKHDDSGENDLHICRQKKETINSKLPTN